MRTYILRRMDDELWRQFKTKAASEGVSIRVLIERLITDYLKTK